MSTGETGMKRSFGIVASALGLILAAGPAYACRIPPPPLIPIRIERTPYDAVAEATVLAHGEDGAEVRYEMIFYGQVEQVVAPLPYHPFDMIISSCGPPRPRVTTGDRILVVLGRHEGRQVALAWIPLDQAERADEFFALYRAERRPAARRRLSERWHAVNIHNGPVPVTNPARWMAPYAGSLGLTGSEARTHAYLEIAGDGRVASCVTSQHGPADARAPALCRRLRRKRFQPPIFARERQGWYEVRWNERVGEGAAGR
jgi:hypothetical protein